MSSGQSTGDATINVTANAPDVLDGADGKCSLREAITNINNGATTYADCATTGAYGTNDKINIPAGTYTSDISSFSITRSVSIVGAGAGSTIIDGARIDRVLETTPKSVDMKVSISNVTITGGFAVSGNSTKHGTVGGGIYNSSTLIVTNCDISGNKTQSLRTGDGGGIYNTGTLTVINSTISGNTAAGGNGGGIANIRTLTITNSTISGNSAEFLDGGGGIYNSGALTVTNSTITGNTDAQSYNSYGNFAGILNSGGTVTLSNSIVQSD